MILAQNPESELAIQVIVMAVFGVICAAVASGRGRSGVAWFFVGFLFVCLGLVVLLALPDVKKEEERHKRQAQENRRLREQIKKERQVADGRHGGVERRLRAHDVALDLDTGGAASLEDGSGGPPPVPAIPESTPWYYAKKQERIGPVSETTLQHLLETHAIEPNTLVWCEGMEDWQRLSEVPDLEHLIGG